jgi:3-methyladenine DNA glycosylase AlkC
MTQSVPYSQPKKCMSRPKIPDAPKSIQKGVPLKSLLDETAMKQLASNIGHVYPHFKKTAFITDGLHQIEDLSLTARSQHIAEMLRKHLPSNYDSAIEILVQSLTPPLPQTKDNGLAGLFYMPHCHFIATYGVDPRFNDGVDPFETSMNAQYEPTQRFTCEFSIRPYLIHDEKRTLGVLYQWMKDDNPHVRRLCSEGTRPRLPWSSKLVSFSTDPSPTLPILEHLKNDSDLYVRRSVANHVGDIAKDHLKLAVNLCEKWLKEASKDLKWVIRHALRNPVKKGHAKSIELRRLAK